MALHPLVESEEPWGHAIGHQIVVQGVGGSMATLAMSAKIGEHRQLANGRL
jgi:hypothetical protein